jgi:hypothetical protein
MSMNGHSHIATPPTPSQPRVGLFVGWRKHMKNLIDEYVMKKDGMLGVVYIAALILSYFLAELIFFII